MTAIASTDGPTAPGGDWSEPDEREPGDVAVYGGIGAFGFEPELSMLSPSAGLNIHLGRFAALTGRTAFLWQRGEFGVPVFGGIRLQIPLGSSTIALGPEVGAAWELFPEDDGLASAPVPALALRTTYEYMLDSGLYFSADASIDVFWFLGGGPRGSLNVGYDF